MDTSMESAAASSPPENARDGDAAEVDHSALFIASPDSNRLDLNDDGGDADGDDLDQLEEEQSVGGDDRAGSEDSFAQAGPGPATLAHRGEKRTASSPASATGGKRRKSYMVSRAGAAHAGFYVPPPLPHYTVVRSARPSDNSPHVIRIHPGVSDADESRWPSVEERQPSHRVDGRSNWFECQPTDGPHNRSFRVKLGILVSRLLGLQPENGKEPWIVEGFPEGNLFTVHHTTTKGGDVRKDTYLFGTPTAPRVRTANEYAPHLYWLLQHGPSDGLRCKCKYCTKQTQGDVNRVLNLPGRSGSPVAAGSSPAPSYLGPRVKSTFNYAPKLSSLGGGSRGSSGPPSSTSAQANLARVASFNDAGGDRLLGPNASAAAVDKAKRRHMKLMDDPASARPKDKLKGKGRELDPEARARKKKKKRLLAEAIANGTLKGSEGEDSDAESSDSDGGRRTKGIPTYRGAFVNRSRDEDLQHCSLPRRGELVYAELPTPLVGVKGSLAGQTLRYWPGIVEGREVKSEAVVVEDDGGAEAQSEGGGAREDQPGQVVENGVQSGVQNGVENGIEKSGTAMEDGATGLESNARAGSHSPPLATADAVNLEGKALRTNSAPRLKTVQSLRFNIRLFAIGDDVRLLREDQVLPWLQHPSPQPLFEDFAELCGDVEATKHIWDGKHLKRATKLFERGSEEAPPTLDEAVVPLALAMQTIAHIVSTFTLRDQYSVTPSLLTPVDPSHPTHQQARERQLRSWAFQSMHFGPELIWTGDFVRVFDDGGRLFEPIVWDSPPTSPNKRALFMEIFGIYKENDGSVESPGSVKVGGDLWELREFGDKVDAPVAADGNGTDGPAASEFATGAVTASPGQSAMSLFEKQPTPTQALTALPPQGPTPNGFSETATDGPLAAPAAPTSSDPRVASKVPSPAAPDAPNGEQVSSFATMHAGAKTLPTPPAGYYWVRLTSEQIHICIDLLAGRYHPLPKSLNTPTKIRETLSSLENMPGDIKDPEARAMVLAGLCPALRLFNQVGLYVGNRKKAVNEATKKAEAEALPYLTGQAKTPTPAVVPPNDPISPASN